MGQCHVYKISLNILFVEIFFFVTRQSLRLLTVCQSSRPTFEPTRVNDGDFCFVSYFYFSSSSTFTGKINNKEKLKVKLKKLEVKNYHRAVISVSGCWESMFFVEKDNGYQRGK